MAPSGIRTQEVTNGCFCPLFSKLIYMIFFFGGGFKKIIEITSISFLA